VKKADVMFVLLLLGVFLPFLVSDSVREYYTEAVVRHALMTSFLKFCFLATLGEVIGLRLSQGVYRRPGFGLLPRALFWGCTGILIKIAFTIFAGGAPIFVNRYVLALPPNVLAGAFSAEKFIAALAISVSMNFMFAPLFMVLHKISDLHIQETGGTLRGYLAGIDFSGILSRIDWSVMWGFVFKKTLPLFWVPAHTITFLLPPHHQVLFAALLGVVLGVILALAGRSESRTAEQTG